MGLKVTHLNVLAGKTHILHDIDLEVESGEFFCFLGSSGCGKSSLIKTIAGLMQEQTGEIVLDGTPLHERAPQKREAIVVFQDLRLFENMTIGENVAYPLRIKGVGKAERLRRAEGYLEQVQLAGFSKRHTGELSGGQAQRVALARALAAEPRLLLLDEPFSSLDENLREDMRALVMSIHRSTGLTTIMVTHDQHEALAMADRIVVMSEGRIVQVGTPKEIYEHPASYEIACYFADGDVLEGATEGGVFRAGGAEGVEISVADGSAPRIAVVRESALKIDLGGLPSLVSELRYQGQRRRATLVCGEAKLHCTFAEDAAPRLGETIHLRIDPGKVLFFDGDGDH